MATCTLRFLYNAENREFSFSDISPTSTVLAAKQLVVERWPSDMTNRPPDATHIRLLFAGKFLEDDKVLQDLPHFSASETTTFHLLVMPPPSDSKAGGAAAGSEKAGGAGGDGGSRSATAAGRCQCVIC